jgi:hypothetical protein
MHVTILTAISYTPSSSSQGHAAEEKSQAEHVSAQTRIGRQQGCQLPQAQAQEQVRRGWAGMGGAVGVGLSCKVRRIRQECAVLLPCALLWMRPGIQTVLSHVLISDYGLATHMSY